MSKRDRVSFIRGETKRGIEIGFLILTSLTIIVVTVNICALRHNHNVRQTFLDKNLTKICGPEFSESSVDISSGKEDSFGNILSADGMLYHPGTYWKTSGQTFGCPCLVKPCIRKCCEPENAHLNKTDATCVEWKTSSIISKKTVHKTTENTEEHNKLKPLNVSDNHFYIFYGMDCPFFRRTPEYHSDDITHLMEDGQILLSDSTTLDHTQYCLEYHTDDSNTVHTYQCFPEYITEPSKEEEEKWTDYVLLVGLSVSIPCLIATFVVYLILPQTHNLHGKCLMCHVASLTVAFITLACLQHRKGPFRVGQTSCIIAAFVEQYSMLVSFFWLNAMCFDIWWVFSGFTSLKGSTKEVQSTKFLMYSIYAGGVPILIVAATAFMEYVSWAPRVFVKPDFGVDSCWFNTDDATVLYFYLPIGVLITNNVIMFSTTFYRLFWSKNEIDKLNNSNSKRHNASDRNRFTLYIHLFIVMGVSWVMEIISFKFGGSQDKWVVSDFINSCQGVLIFIIFVCKRRILYQLNQRICPHINVFGSTRYTRGNSRTTSSRMSNEATVKLRKTSATSVNNV